MSSLHRTAIYSLILGCMAALSSCSSTRQEYVTGRDTKPRAVLDTGIAITLRDQKLTYVKDGKKVKEYPISSSKFGIGTRYGSNKTPYGLHSVSDKVGAGHPVGAVFKGGRPTGEVVPVNAKGRDPIVTRVIFLDGHENANDNTDQRRIYIHGTPEERNIGRPASYGCIRMRSTDIIDLYKHVGRGTPVLIDTCSQNSFITALAQTKAKKANYSVVLPTRSNRPAIYSAARLRALAAQVRKQRISNLAAAAAAARTAAKQ